MKKIYLVGAGGHARACIDVIELGGQYEIAGLFDAVVPKGTDVFGYKVLGGDAEIPAHIGTGEFLITVGQIKTSEIRRKIQNQLESLGAKFATVISPRAHVSRHSHVGVGTVIMHDVLIQAAASVGDHCIINNKALIEHDARVGSFCHVSTASVVNGACVVEDGAFVGSNAVLQQGATVSRDFVVSAGSFFKRGDR